MSSIKNKHTSFRQTNLSQPYQKTHIVTQKLHTLLAYLKWLPKTVHIHGIHSPFIFKFEKEVLRGKSDPGVSQQLYSYRNALLDCQETIEVMDYSADPTSKNSGKRKIKDIAKNAGATYKHVLLLQRLMDYLQPQEVLELGSSLGIAIAALAINNQAQVISIEGCLTTAALAQKRLDSAGIENVLLCVGDFKEQIKKYNHKKFDFVYFDGKHANKATLAYLEDLRSTTVASTVWMFDDIHWSLEMTATWEAVKALPEISATIDCFDFGMAFFRPQQAKEDFYIKL